MSSGITKKLPIDFNLGPGTHALLQCAWFPDKLSDLEGEVEKEDVNVVFGGVRPLDVAILNNNVGAVKMLLKLGADPLLKNEKNYMTSVSLAVEMGHLAALDELLASDLKVLDFNYGLGNTILHQAVLASNKSLCVHLIKQFPELIGKQNRRGETALMLSTRMQDSELFFGLYQEVVRRRYDPFQISASGLGIFSFAMHNKSQEIARKLLIDALPFSELQQGVHEAVMTQQWAFVELLSVRSRLAKAKQCNEKKASNVSTEPDTRIPFYLDITNTTNKDMSSKNLLFHAILLGNEKKVRAYKIAGYSLNETDSLNHNGLYYAVLCGHSHLVERFETRLGQWDQKNDVGNTAVHMAFGPASSIDVDKVVDLPTFKANMSKLLCLKNKANESLWHYAHYFDNKQALALLSRESVPVENDNQGYSPHYWGKRRESVAYLRELSHPYWQDRFSPSRADLPNFSLSTMEALEHALKLEAKFMKQGRQLTPLYRTYLMEMTGIIKELEGIVKKEVIPDHQSAENKEFLLEKLSKLGALALVRLGGK